MEEGLRDVRTALLEADVNFTVANDFIGRVKEKSIGQEVLRKVDPSEQIVRIVYEELVGLMGPVDHRFHFARTGRRWSCCAACKAAAKRRRQASWRSCCATSLAESRSWWQRLATAGRRRADQVLGDQLNIPVYSEGRRGRWLGQGRGRHRRVQQCRRSRQADPA